MLWVALGEWVTRLFGLQTPEAWSTRGFALVERILALGLIGPLAEELMVRGLLYHRLRQTRWGVVGAIVLGSLFWTVLHSQYGLGILALIFLDGLALGWARHTAQSTWVPLAMHVLGNAYSIWQSLSMPPQ